MCAFQRVAGWTLSNASEIDFVLQRRSGLELKVEDTCSPKVNFPTSHFQMEILHGYCFGCEPSLFMAEPSLQPLFIFFHFSLSGLNPEFGLCFIYYIPILATLDFSFILNFCVCWVHVHSHATVFVYIRGH